MLGDFPVFLRRIRYRVKANDDFVRQIILILARGSLGVFSE